MATGNSSIFPVLGQANPISVVAAGTLVSGWIDASQAHRIITLLMAGAGGGTPALSFRQANTAAGGGAKALAWSAGTLASSRIYVDNDPAQLDVAGGFRWIEVTATVTGGTGTVVGFVVLGGEPKLAN